MNTPQIPAMKPREQVAYLTMLASSFRPLVEEWGSDASLGDFDRAVRRLSDFASKGNDTDFSELETSLSETPDGQCDDSALPAYYSMRAVGTIHSILELAREAQEDDQTSQESPHLAGATDSIDDLVRDLLSETKDAAGATAQAELQDSINCACASIAETFASGGDTLAREKLLASAVGELRAAYRRTIPQIAQHRGWIRVMA